MQVLAELTFDHPRMPPLRVRSNTLWVRFTGLPTLAEASGDSVGEKINPTQTRRT
jgi:hypothetical protein